MVTLEVITITLWWQQLGHELTVFVPDTLISGSKIVWEHAMAIFPAVSNSLAKLILYMSGG